MPTTDSVPKVHVQRQSTTAQMIRFTNRVQKERESATEYARGVEELLDTLFPALDATTRDDLLQDRFVNGLRDREIRKEVRRTKAIMKCINKGVNLQGLVHVAERFTILYSEKEHRLGGRARIVVVVDACREVVEVDDEVVCRLMTWLTVW